MRRPRREDPRLGYLRRLALAPGACLPVQSGRPDWIEARPRLERDSNLIRAREPSIALDARQYTYRPLGSPLFFSGVPIGLLSGLGMGLFSRRLR